MRIHISIALKMHKNVKIQIKPRKKWCFNRQKQSLLCHRTKSRKYAPMSAGLGWTETAVGCTALLGLYCRLSALCYGYVSPSIIVYLQRQKEIGKEICIYCSSIFITYRLFLMRSTHLFIDLTNDCCLFYVFCTSNCLCYNIVHKTNEYIYKASSCHILV